jgi:hypothetical protein
MTTWHAIVVLAKVWGGIVALYLAWEAVRSALDLWEDRRQTRIRQAVQVEIDRMPFLKANPTPLAKLAAAKAARERMLAEEACRDTLWGENGVIH